MDVTLKSDPDGLNRTLIGLDVATASEVLSVYSRLQRVGATAWGLLVPREARRAIQERRGSGPLRLDHPGHATPRGPVSLSDGGRVVPAVMAWADLHGLSPARATLELARSAGLLADLTYHRLARAIGEPPGLPLVGLPVRVRPTFRKCGDHWHLRFDGAEAHLDDGVGLARVHHLLARPGVWVPSLQLALLDPAVVAAPVPMQARLDARYVRDLLLRAEAARREIVPAGKRGDLAAARALEREVERIEDTLTTDTGPGGKNRRIARDALAMADESVRKSVRRAWEAMGAGGAERPGAVSEGRRDVRPRQGALRARPPRPRTGNSDRQGPGVGRGKNVSCPNRTSRCRDEYR